MKRVKIYLADLFRKAADRYLSIPSEMYKYSKKGKDKHSCVAVMLALDGILGTDASGWCLEYIKSQRTKTDYQSFPAHYKVLDWMAECGVKCGSIYNFKNSDSPETQYTRFMWLEMLALIAEDEGAFVECEVE